MRERIEALRDKTQRAVCLSHHQWAYQPYESLAYTMHYEEQYEVWVASLSQHFRAATADEAMTNAERACADA